MSDCKHGTIKGLCSVCDRKPDTVTISRECAERSRSRASYYLEASYNTVVGPEALKDFNELTEAMENNDD